MAGITIVQTASGSHQNPGTFTGLNFASNITAGNDVIILAVGGSGTSGFRYTGATPSASGQNGTLVSGASGTSGQAAGSGGSTYCTVAIGYVANCPGGSSAVNLTPTGGYSGTAYAALVAFEVSGLYLSNGGAVDLSNFSSSATSTETSWNSGSTGTLTDAVELAVGIAVAQADNSITGPSSPWTNTSGAFGSSVGSYIGGYQVTAATTGLSYSYTLSADYTVSSIVTFYPGTAPIPPAAGMPAIQPGPTWLARFKPGLPKPRPMVPPPNYLAVAAAGSGSLGVTASASATVFPPDMPQVYPGPAWLAHFKPGLPRPRPIVPYPSIQQVTATGSPSLGITATGTATIVPTPDMPVIQPGPAWFHRFKPGMPKPRPAQIPSAPSTIGGACTLTLTTTANVEQIVTGSSGSLGVTASASATVTPPMGVPAILPGPAWLAYFKPGLPKLRPLEIPYVAPPPQQGTGTASLGVTATGVGQVTQTGMPVLAPGPAWLAHFKPGLRKPRPPVPIPLPPPPIIGTGRCTLGLTQSATPNPLQKTLIVSIAAQAGTDTYGNAYVQGLGVYGYGELVAPTIIADGDTGGFFVYAK